MSEPFEFHPSYALLIDAANGWVAIGFSEDRVMGKDAAIMATATTVTSRWNTALPKVSLQTQDIGVKNATVKATDKMLYAVMEVPLKFEARNPLDGATLKINMEYGCHFLAAAGPHSQSGPSYHHLKNAAEKLVTIENGGESSRTVIKLLLLSCVCLLTLM